MPIFVSHPVTNANVRNLLEALYERRLLGKFFTTIAFLESGFVRFLLRFSNFRDLRRRLFPARLKGFISTSPVGEFVRLMARKAGLGPLIRHESGFFSVDRIGRCLDRKVGRAVKKGNIEGVYCFEDFALDSFKAARSRGARCIYEHPVVYWRVVHKIMQEEAAAKPEWAATMPGMRDSESKLARKDAELRGADRIVVASSFSEKSLAECPFPLAPVSLVRYGAPAPARPAPKLGRSPRKLRVLFVGGLSQMKGIAYLDSAMNLLGDGAELTVIGRRAAAGCRPLDSFLQRHRWVESLPNFAILQEMQQHDVLVFPSLSEGFGLVVTEALSQGLPVITTSHTCGPDVLSEGRDGFIVPIRDSQAIAEKLELLHRDRERLAEMSDAACKKAESLTWESYQRSIADVVQEALASA